MDAHRENAAYSHAEPRTLNNKAEPRVLPGNFLTSVGRIRCFIESDRSSPIPRIEGIDYTIHAEDDFDIFVATDPHNGSFAEFIARCGSPAAPMIGFADHPHPRADFLIKEPNDSNFAAAISSLQPLLKKTTALPALPRGMDRNGLIALALMYTRNCRLDAVWQPNDPAVVEYPLLRGIENARTILEDMADAELVRRRFYQRVHQCSKCYSSRLHARECCTSCHSSQLVEHPLVHHYSCAFQGSQPLFETPDGYVCPKCHKQLRHYGVDYDKPGSVISCADCGAVQSEPEVGFTCLDCNQYTSGDQAAHRNWYHYELLPDGVAALRSGELPRVSDTEPNLRVHPFRIFRQIAAQLIIVAQRHDRPLTICRIRLDTKTLTAQAGHRGFMEICRFVRDLIAENLREGDLLTSLPDGSFVCCMPEIGGNTAQLACRHLQNIIARSIRQPIETSAEIIERDAAKPFLNRPNNVW